MASSSALSNSVRDELATTALLALENSYSPYSHFRVGAALLCQDGTIVQGCNIENAAYSPSNCAERTAIFKAVSDGRRGFMAIAIASDLDEPCSPCGVCRQVLREFCLLEIPILLVPSSFGRPDGKAIVETTLGEMLPMSFGPDQLSRPRVASPRGAIAT